MTIFPPITSRTSTVQVLKAPKTQTSTRKIFLPRTVAEMLAKLASSPEFASLLKILAKNI